MNDSDSTDANDAMNAYAPPATDIRQNPIDSAGAPKLGPDEARRFYNHSRSIGALVFLWCLGLVIMAAILVPNVLESAKRAGGNPDLGLFFAIVGGMVLLLLAGIVGCWRRESWGRVVGMVLCALMLFNFWIGTLIGIFGLIELARSSRLFGPGRLTHRHLKATVAAYKATTSTRRRR